MPSDDLLTPTNQTSSQWNLLESRVNRLMESVVLLRDINKQLKNNNDALVEELKNIHQSGSQQDLDNLRRQHDEALQDLKQVKQNLQKIESLANELNLEGY